MRPLWERVRPRATARPHPQQQAPAKVGALSYADRVQQSVFEAYLTDIQLRILARTLTTISNPDEDDIRIYPQCARCASLRQLIGKAMPTLAPLLVVA